MGFSSLCWLFRLLIISSLPIISKKGRVGSLGREYNKDRKGQNGEKSRSVCGDGQIGFGKGQDWPHFWFVNLTPFLGKILHYLEASSVTASPSIGCSNHHFGATVSMNPGDLPIPGAANETLLDRLVLNPQVAKTNHNQGGVFRLYSGTG